MYEHIIYIKAYISAYLYVSGMWWIIVSDALLST